MARAFLFFLLGYLEVRITGERLERLINLAVSQGIYVWDVRRREDGLRLKIGLLAFWRLRPVARKVGCRVRILRKRGWPFLWRRAARRRLLLGGVAAAILLFYILSSHVWFIQVIGLKEVPEAKVLAGLARLGLRPGVYQGSLDLERIANRLPGEVRELSWAGIHLRGTKAIVEVAERTLLVPRQQPDDTPADVVAAKDGLITGLLVLMGEGAVAPGQTVQRGQVLIRGIISPWEGEVPEDYRGPGPRAIRARGIVRARVWYDTYIEAPLRPKIAVRTGAVHTRRLLLLAGRRLVLTGFRPVPFSDYQLEETRLRPAPWRKTPIPVELVTLKYFEVLRKDQVITQGDAVRRAQAEAHRRLAAEVPATARILRESSQVTRRDEDRIVVRLVIETEEDIGEVRRGFWRETARTSAG